MDTHRARCLHPDGHCRIASESAGVPGPYGGIDGPGPWTDHGAEWFTFPGRERMSEQRRYEDREIAEIFETAAVEGGPEAHAPAGGGGLSLRELQGIGSEVGIAPERIAGAAAALELRRGLAPSRTHLGMPVSVGRTVDLPRAPTDREWDVILADLRQTFGAHGKDRSQGGLRAWTNGNLHSYVEPTEAGYRLRMGTAKGDSTVIAWLGAVGVLMGVLMLALFFLTGGEANEFGAAVLVATMGAVALAFNALRLPRWAEERHAQIEAVSVRVGTLMAADPAPEAIAAGG